MSQGLYLQRTVQTQKKRRHTSKARVGFEPTISFSERAETFYIFRVLDCAATLAILKDKFKVHILCTLPQYFTETSH